MVNYTTYMKGNVKCSVYKLYILFIMTFINIKSILNEH